MGILSKIFTWWDGATIGTHARQLAARRTGGHRRAGQPLFPRPEEAKSVDGRERRWVIYNGANDASRVPAEWHGWLHGSFDGVPESNLPPPRIWEADYTPNATGTPMAYRPQGALERGGVRARATGDYEAWSPDA
jgi:NADH:ubiquinone oxidoreductase subunit